MIERYLNPTRTTESVRMIERYLSPTKMTELVRRMTELVQMTEQVPRDCLNRHRTIASQIGRLLS